MNNKTYLFSWWGLIPVMIVGFYVLSEGFYWAIPIILAAYFLIRLKMSKEVKQ